MFLSLGLILLFGLLMGWVSKQLRLPSLTGMLLVGIVLGPYVFNLIDPSILNVSAQLRKIALIIILARAGLTLDIQDLKKVGRPAILMCFLPACFEIFGFVLLAPRFLDLSVLEAGILGTVIAAVSPAVVVPKMIRLIEEGYGHKHAIPQIILAGASVDDVFVIVMFTAFTSLALGQSISFKSFFNIPISIVTGGVVGILIGIGFARFFEKFHMRDTIKVILFLSFCFFLVSYEELFGSVIPFASLIGVMAIGLGLSKRRNIVAIRLSNKLNKLWICAEIFLFVLVGATVNIHYALQAGVNTILLIVFTLLFRMLGVLVCLLKTKLTRNERLFCMIAYTPKATVQAAIGGVPLAMGLACGNIVLIVAVIAILLTAPLGAFAIEFFTPRLLDREKSVQ